VCKITTAFFVFLINGGFIMDMGSLLHQFIQQMINGISAG
jgi:hypothetical protein